jgi:hypothetical protein
VQREGGTIEQIRPGDIVWIKPGEKHWHGASATTAMTHIAIAETLEGKVVEWMEKVSDEQYGRCLTSEYREGLNDSSFLVAIVIFAAGHAGRLSFACCGAGRHGFMRGGASARTVVDGAAVTQFKSLHQRSRGGAKLAAPNSIRRMDTRSVCLPLRSRATEMRLSNHPAES